MNYAKESICIAIKTRNGGTLQSHYTESLFSSIAMVVFPDVGIVLRLPCHPEAFSLNYELVYRRGARTIFDVLKAYGQEASYSTYMCLPIGMTCIFSTERLVLAIVTVKDAADVGHNVERDTSAPGQDFIITFE